MMQIHPNRTAVLLTGAGLVLLVTGVIMNSPHVVNWGGSLLIGVILARSASLHAVARIRAAGFEMLWRSGQHHRRVARRETLVLKAEILNRDSRAARFVGLRATHSPGLEVEVTPDNGEVPANCRLEVDIAVTGLRVGAQPIHGLSLEICAGPGLFEIPLTFTNPMAVEVLPRAYGILARSARGGRSRSVAEVGRPGPLSGDSTELRELREHQPGDPFKRIAWKASARRGTLLVKDYQREERDLVWLVLDASVELWAGREGSAPLDLAIDEVASVALDQLRRGNRVAMTIVAHRVLAELEPGRTPEHALKLLTTLTRGTHFMDADRSGLDEADVAARVLEHLGPAALRGSSGVSAGNIDGIAALAREGLRRAPMIVGMPLAPTPREAVLRQYMGTFGLSNHVRLEPDRPRTDHLLADLITRLPNSRSRPSRIIIWSPPPVPGTRPVLEDALSRRRRRGTLLSWVPMHQQASIPSEGGPFLPAAAAAVSVRARVADARGSRFLRTRGVQLESPLRPPRRPSDARLAAPSTSVKLAAP